VPVAEGAVGVDRERRVSRGERLVHDQRAPVGGDILAEIALPDALHAFACALGGDDGRTLLIAAAPDFDPSARAARSESLLLTTHVTVPRIGFQD
jgi:hypothetical protein